MTAAVAAICKQFVVGAAVRLGRVAGSRSHRFGTGIDQSPGAQANSIQSDRRAASTIGTLVIFIAMLLIAATTAAVFFDLVGILGSETEQTGEATASELADRVEVVAITGNNITETNGDREVNRVEVVLRGARGSDPIDLRNVSVQWIGDRGYVLHEASVAGPTDDQFRLVEYTDVDGSFPVLTDENDRFALQFEPGVEFGDRGLQEEASVDLMIMSPSGSTLDVSFTVPRSLAGQQSVEL